MRMVFSFAVFAVTGFSLLGLFIMAPQLPVNISETFRTNWYQALDVYIALAMMGFVSLALLNLFKKYWHFGFMSLVGAVIVSSSYIQLFPAQQKVQPASYYDTEVADKFIPTSDNRVYVTNIGGETRIFPRYHLQLSQAAEWSVDGTDYVMTFSNSSNLPVVVEVAPESNPSQMQLLKEVDNNLVLKHQDHRIVMQQIMVSDGAKLGPFTQPNTMMTWEQAKEMYPNALVYLVDFNESQFDENAEINSSLYPDTLALESDRATPDGKQEVYGYNNGEQQVAIHPHFAESNHGTVISIGDELLQIGTDGDVVQLFDLVTGKQMHVHNGVYLEVWSHFFPDTALITYN